MTKQRIMTWLPTVFYTLAIFLTLPYLPTIFAALEVRCGRAAVSSGTNMSLVAVAALLVGYLAIWRKQRRKSAYLCLAGLLAVYGYCIHRLPVASERIHLAEYGLLAFLILRGLRKEGIEGRQLYAWAATATYLVGTADEWVQWFLPNRVGELRDVLLNGLCGALGLCVTALVVQPAPQVEGRRSTGWKCLVAAAIIGIVGSLVLGMLPGR